MKISCLIIEDEPASQEILSATIRDQVPALMAQVLSELERLGAPLDLGARRRQRHAGALRPCRHRLQVGLLRRVGDVDHDPPAVRFGDHLAAQRGQAAFLQAVGRAADFVIEEVGQAGDAETDKACAAIYEALQTSKVEVLQHLPGKPANRRECRVAESAERVERG